MTAKSHPSPGPKRPISRRLENVRESEGVSLKGFWRRLRDEGGLELSYVAARNYHYDREPPLSYVVAVSEVYEVSLDWLATGHGEPEDIARWRMEEREPSEVEKRIDSELFDGFYGLTEGEEPTGFRLSGDAWFHLRTTWLAVRSKLMSGPLEDSTKEYELARRIGEACAAPLKVLGLDPVRMSMDDASDYVVAISAAFRMAARLSHEED